MKSSVLDDNNAFIIEKIIQHELVQTRNKPMLNLQIKWHGYKEPEWTAILTSLKRNKAVQEYLQAKGLNRFGLPQSDKSEPPKKRVRFSSSVPEESTV